jgi:hypothetical protein
MKRLIKVLLIVVFLILLVGIYCQAEETAPVQPKSAIVSPIIDIWHEIYSGVQKTGLSGIYGYSYATQELIPAAYLELWQSKHKILGAGVVATGPKDPTSADDWKKCNIGPGASLAVGKGFDLVLKRPTIFSSLKAVGVYQMIESDDPLGAKKGWFAGITAVVAF